LTAGTPHQALYRRWRAQTFSEIVGQEAVVATLRNAVRTNQVAHAILFTGPRGTGKTSLARILAKAINCDTLGPDADPCDTCGPCVAIREGTTLDVLEIDAASNRGIEAVRDLRERLNYPPGELRRKIYILDEAHQITKDAWNALLKSLEEPPDFVVFMFASTHPQGFPPAILSRLQRFDVRRLTAPEITGKLQRILAADGREADPEAVAVVARLAEGGMRDAESILDQLLASTAGRIEAEAVRDLLGLADAELVGGFVTALASGDAATGIGLLDRLEERGRDLRIFIDQVVDALRERLLADLAAGGAADPDIATAARRLAAIDPTRLGPGGLRLQLELLLLDPSPVVRGLYTAAGGSPGAAASGSRGAAVARPADGPTMSPQRPGPAAAPARDPVPGKTLAPAPDNVLDRFPGSDPELAREAPPMGSPPGDPAAQATPPRSAAPLAATGLSPEDDLGRLLHVWRALVADLGRRPALKQLIEASRPVSVEGNVVTLGFPEEKAFLRDHAEKRKAAFEAAIGDRLGHAVSVRCVISNLDALPPLPDDQEAASILEEAHRIFADERIDVPEVT